jgi:ketosteroid isomerase-like protein
MDLSGQICNKSGMAMIRRYLRFALAVLVLTVSGPALAGNAETEVAAQADRWNAAYAAADWTALRALYSDDAWLMTDKAPAAKGPDAIVAYLRRFRDMGATVTFRFEPENVLVERRMAVMVSKYWMTAQLPGKPAIRTAGRSILIYRKVGKGWLLWRDMDNTTPDVKVE